MRNNMKAIKRLTPYLTLALLAVILYQDSLHAYFCLDDGVYMGYGMRTRATGNLIEPFTYGIQPQTYRPVSIHLLFMVLTFLFGTNAFYYHLVNLALFMLVNFVLYCLIKRIVGSKFIALLSVLVYMTRSAHSLLMYYIAAGANELLMSLFFLMSFIGYINYRDTRNRAWYCLSLLLYLLSVLSKETGVFLPIILLIYELTLRKSDDRVSGFGYIRDKLKLPLPFFIAMATYLYVKFSIIEVRADLHDYNIDLGWHVLVNLINYVLASFDAHPLWMNNDLTFRVIPSSGFILAFFALFTYLLFTRSRYRNALLFSLAWYLTLMTHLLLLSRAMPYYAHLSLVGFSLFVGIILNNAYLSLAKISKFKANAILVLFLFLVVVGAKHTIEGVYDRSDISELQHAAKACVEEIESYDLPAGETAYIIDRREGRYYHAEGHVKRATAHGSLFGVILGRQVAYSFEYDNTDPMLTFRYTENGECRRIVQYLPPHDILVSI